MINPQHILIGSVVVLVGLLFYFAGNVAEPAQLEPGAAFAYSCGLDPVNKKML